MSYSYTTTESFTIAHARRLAAKVSADMEQCRRLYGKPSAANIAEYQEELTVMLHGGYVSEYEFGFKTTEDRRVVSWKYAVSADGDLQGGRSGGLYTQANISNASLFNFMSYSDDWFALDAAERDKVKGKHTVRRVTGEPPADGSGWWVRDKTYSAGGVAIERQEFRPWSA
jgi:hypothetical protein